MDDEFVIHRRTTVPDTLERGGWRHALLTMRNVYLGTDITPLLNVLLIKREAAYRVGDAFGSEFDKSLERERRADGGAQTKAERVTRRYLELAQNRFSADETRFAFLTERAFVFVVVSNRRHASMTALQVVNRSGDPQRPRFALRWTNIVSERHEGDAEPRERRHRQSFTELGDASPHHNYVALLTSISDDALGFGLVRRQLDTTRAALLDERLVDEIRAAAKGAELVAPFIDSRNALPGTFALNWALIDALARIHGQIYVDAYAEPPRPFDPSLIDDDESGTIAAQRRLAKIFGGSFIDASRFLTIVQLAFVYYRGAVPYHLLRNERATESWHDNDDNQDIWAMQHGHHTGQHFRTHFELP